MRQKHQIGGHPECPDFFIGVYRGMRRGRTLSGVEPTEGSSRPKVVTKRHKVRQRVAVVIGIVVVVIFMPVLADAQCSMCRAVTESNLKTDDAFTIGNGLNNAIVYLMFMPYILAGIFAYAFYGKQIRAWLKKKFA